MSQFPLLDSRYKCPIARNLMIALVAGVDLFPSRSLTARNLLILRWSGMPGKGRKERQVPLWNSTARQIKRWLQEQVPCGSEQPLFPAKE